MDDLFVLMIELQLLCGDTRDDLRRQDAANEKRRRFWHPDGDDAGADDALQACAQA